MSQPSFKTMIKDGTVKRADAMKVRLEDLHEEPGFNLREEGEDLEASIDALAQHLIGGGQIPALEVRPRAEGGVYIVDGHRRGRAIPRALAAGAQLADKDGQVWVSVVPFTGNDADRVARIMTSAEGRALSPLETAKGYKRLAAFGWESERIAKTVGKTRQHVDQLLILANAPSQVHKMVGDGAVSAAVAVNVVREHGDQSGAVLDKELHKAKANGKKKVTAGTMKPKALPRGVVDGLVDAVDAFAGQIDNITRAGLETYANKDEHVQINLPVWLVLELVAQNQAILDTKAANTQQLREQQANDNQGVIEGAA